MAKQNTPNDKSAGGKRNSKKRYYTYRKVNKKHSLQPPKAKEAVRVAFLCGMNEIGKKRTIYEGKFL